MSPDDHVTTARAVYDASAGRYVELVGTEVSPAIEGPIDRSLLDAFAEIVADLGCGPGRVAARVWPGGVDVIGIDVSPAMLDAARRAHPDIGWRRTGPTPTGPACPSPATGTSSTTSPGGWTAPASTCGRRPAGRPSSRTSRTPRRS